MTGQRKQATKGSLRPCEFRRYAAYAKAAEDPELVMASIETAFADLLRLVRRGERAAAAGASAEVADRVLQLCAVQAVSAEQAENKTRFLAVIARWSLSRNPRLTAVLQATRQGEMRRWGLDVDEPENRPAQQ